MYNNLNKIEFLEFFEEELQKALVRAKKGPNPENILWIKKVVNTYYWNRFDYFPGRKIVLPPLHVVEKWELEEPELLFIRVSFEALNILKDIRNFKRIILSVR